MAVRIIVDSASDITVEQAEKLNVGFVPLRTEINGIEYRDGIDITHEEFFGKLAACSKLPTTSQPSPLDFMREYEIAAAAGEDVVVIVLSSKLSGTYESACIAAQGREGGVFVVDSLNATVAEQILVEYAVRLRDEGKEAAAIAEELESVKSRVHLVACVDTLEYLMKGGRVSKTAAAAGGLLKIKPILSLREGEIVLLGKARGSKQSNNYLNTEIEKAGGIEYALPVRLVYSGEDDHLLRDYIEHSQHLWKGLVAESAADLPVSTLGSTIGTHAGPGAVGVAFFAPADSRFTSC